MTFTAIGIIIIAIILILLLAIVYLAGVIKGSQVYRTQRQVKEDITIRRYQ